MPSNAKQRSVFVRPGRGFLNNPGPTPVPERVLSAMHRQSLDLVDEQLTESVDRCFDGLRPIFGTKDAELFIYAANGHGGWEATIVNVLAPGDKVLLPQTGLFSWAWGDMAEHFGVEVETLPHSVRHAFDMKLLEARLRADKRHQIKAVMLVHTDTSSGLTSDVAGARKALDAAKHPALLMVDAVASLGSVPFEMDRWGVDVAVTGSQKALMCPPGLAMVAASDKAMAVHKKTDVKRRYWDWTIRAGRQGYFTFYGTAPIHLIFGLDEALTMIAEEGLPAVFARHRLLSGAVHAAVDAWAEAGAVEANVTRPKDRAVSTTTVLMNAAYDPEVLRRQLRLHLRTSIAGGLGAFENKAFRIGHMGDTNEPMILGALATIQTGFEALGIPYGEGALGAATRHIAANKKKLVGTAKRETKKKGKAA